MIFVKSLSEINFPAVTVCSQGLNMENVARAVERDFYDWHQEQPQAGDSRHEDSLQERMALYLREKFDIDDSDPSLLEIIQSMTSVGGPTAIMAESLTKNVKKCSEREKTADATLEEESIEKRKIPIHRGTDCPLMIDYNFAVNTTKSSGKAD